jgi:hypothetical protein
MTPDLVLCAAVTAQVCLRADDEVTRGYLTGEGGMRDRTYEEGHLAYSGGGRDLYSACHSTPVVPLLACLTASHVDAVLSAQVTLGLENVLQNVGVNWMLWKAVTP